MIVKKGLPEKAAPFFVLGWPGHHSVAALYEKVYCRIVPPSPLSKT